MTWLAARCNGPPTEFALRITWASMASDASARQRPTAVIAAFIASTPGYWRRSLLLDDQPAQAGHEVAGLEGFRVPAAQKASRREIDLVKLIAQTSDQKTA